MRSVRAAVKVFLLILYTLTTYGIYLFVYGFLKLLRIRFEAWRNLFMFVWAKGMSVILNVRINTEGTPPEAPFFLVSNHLSYLDIVPIYINLNCTFVAKKEVRSWPLLGFMVKTTGVIFVDRSRKRDVTRVNEVLSESLNRHQGMVLFPEGTTSGGESVLPFRPPLLDYPASENIPVHYASIQYKTDEASGDLPADKSVCFYAARDPFHKHVMKLASNRKIDCKITFCDQPVQSSDRKDLALKLHRGINTIFEPTS